MTVKEVDEETQPLMANLLTYEEPLFNEQLNDTATDSDDIFDTQ